MEPWSLTVAGQGDISINNHITLRNVLHVPKLYSNLLSIQNLQEIWIVMWFFILRIVYLRTRKRGGGLDALGRNMDFTTLRNQVDEAKLEIIFLCHYFLSLSWQLVILCLTSLKLCFPYCSKKQVLKLFIVLFVDLAKHKSTSFQISNKRSTLPFSLIHSDIWGRSTIPNISGAHWFVSFIDEYSCDLDLSAKK